MHRGYTKRWRKRWDKGYHQDTLLWALMDYFIDHANYKNGKIIFNGKKITVKRGQHVFGRASLARFFNVNSSSIYRKLKKLENMHFLNIKSNNRYSIATVINYNTYQAEDFKANSKPNDKRTTNPQKANSKPNTPKEYKERKEGEEVPDSALILAFKKFEDWRSGNNNEMDPSFKDEMLDKLKDMVYYGQDPLAVVEQSIQNGWLKLYPVSAKKKEDDGSEAAKKRIAKTQDYINNLKNTAGETPSVEHIRESINKIKSKGNIFR